MTDLIKRYEGFSSKAYKCPAGIWTIGYGNTQWPNGDPIREGQNIGKTVAEEMMRDYISKEIDPVFKKIPYRLTEGQKDAIRSLIYNWNMRGFLASKLYKAICKKDWGEVCRQWDYGFKNNLNGLFKRRTEELYMFIKDIK